MLSSQAREPGSRARVLGGLTVLVSTATLVVSLTLPTVTFQVAGKPQEVYSIFGGIESLWVDGNPILASIVFLFSMVFPVAKLLALGILWLGRGTPGGRLATLHWLELLGKWSMLDVFIIGVFVGAIRLGLAVATSRPGIYVFAAAILMSMLSTLLFVRLETGGAPRSVRGAAELGSGPARALTSVTAVATGLALALPILHIQRLFLFNRVALPATTLDMARSGELFLAIALGAAVIVAPALRALVLLRLRWLPGGGGSPRTLRLALALDEWAMLDVYGLGLLIVYVKLDQLAETQLLAGFWWVVAAAALSELDAFLFRRQVSG